MRKRPVVLTIATNGLDRFYERCIHTHLTYAKRYDYRHFLISDAGCSLTPNESAWIRIPIMRILIETAPVFYVDADAEFRLAAPPIDSVHVPGKAVYMAYGISGRFNSGVIYLSEPYASSYLDEMLANYNTPIPRPDQAPYENGHFIHFAKKHSNIIHRLEDRWNNTVSEEMDDYIRHYTNALRHLRPRRKADVWSRATATAKGLLSRANKHVQDETTPERLSSLAARLVAVQHSNLARPSSSRA